MNFQSLAGFTCRIVLIFAVLSADAVVYCQLLQVRMQSREPDSNSIGLECRETFVNGTVITTTDIELFLYNDEGQQVKSLLGSHGIVLEFTDGVLTFDIEQDIEGCYYCSRDPSAGVPASFRTILARPRAAEDVQKYYELEEGESVTLRSGVGEGALADHYTAVFNRKEPFVEFTNISRGNDFSLTLTSLELSDSGVYIPSVTIETGSGSTYLVRELPTITLTVYKSPVIEVPPESVVSNEEGTSVSFTCIATGGPNLRVSWFRGGMNITRHTPSHYTINETVVNGGTKVVTMVTIHRPNYKESGEIECVATIMEEDRADEEQFRAKNTAELTVLESEFYLKTLITEHKQIQLWVELQIPISLYAVTAVVYFTLIQEPNQRPQPVQTHSIVANTTVMVFQLEPHEVPEKYRNEDFYVQVALRVNSVETALVPNNLETAHTANLNEPTETDCNRDKTYRIIVIVGGSVIGTIVVLAALSVLLFCCYKGFYECQRTLRRKNMTEDERKNLQQQKMELYKSAEEGDKDSKKLAEKMIDQIDTQLRGDGRNKEEEN